MKLTQGKSFENSPINLMTTKERTVLRQEIGMVFQGSALFDSMTVEGKYNVSHANVYKKR